MRKWKSFAFFGGREGFLSARKRSIAAHFDFSSVSQPFDRIPSPKGLPFIGTTLSLLLAGGPTKLHEYIDGRHKELGPIFKDNVGPVKAVFVSDAEEIRNVFAKEGKYPYHIKPESWLVYNEKHNLTRGLFFMDGEEWLQSRRILNNLLLRGDLSWIDSCCASSCDLFLSRISSSAGSELRNLESELYKWSMNVMVSVLVGPERFREMHQDMGDIVAEVSKKVFLIFERTVDLQLISARFGEKYGIGRWRRFEKSVTEGLEAARKVIDLVMDPKFGSSDGLIDRMLKSGLDRSQIENISIDLILGAGDTTSNAMAWSLHLLSKYNSIQENLHSQLKKDKSAVKNLIRETLRLYPPAPFLTRILPLPSTLCGYNIPPRTLIVMSIYTSGRDPRYFEYPEKFLPDRWKRDYNPTDSHRISASLPFGIGARSCVGRKIAESQLVDSLGKIIEGYRIKSVNEGEIAAVCKMVIKPSEPIRLIFNKRSTS